MRDSKLHFLNEELAENLVKITREFLGGSESGEDLLNRAKKMLPVHKTDQSTWKARVEGYYEISEELFKSCVDKGKVKYGDEWDRQKVVNEAKLRPFSYYHWLTGSREPIDNVLTRYDYLNDPTTAMVKLEDDIKSLTNLYRALV